MGVGTLVGRLHPAPASDRIDAYFGSTLSAFEAESCKEQVAEFSLRNKANQMLGNGIGEEVCSCATDTDGEYGNLNQLARPANPGDCCRAYFRWTNSISFFSCQEDGGSD